MRKIPWPTVFGFTILGACGIMYMFYAALMTYIYPSFLGVLGAWTIFIFAGTRLIEWVSKYI